MTLNLELEMKKKGYVVPMFHFKLPIRISSKIMD